MLSYIYELNKNEFKFEYKYELLNERKAVNQIKIVSKLCLRESGFLFVLIVLTLIL